MIDYQKIQQELHPLLVTAEQLRKKHRFFQKAFSIMVVAMFLGFLFLPIITFSTTLGSQTRCKAGLLGSLNWQWFFIGCPFLFS